MKAKELAELIGRELKLFPDMNIEIEESKDGYELNIKDIIVENGIVIIRTDIDKLINKIDSDAYDYGYECGERDR